MVYELVEVSGESDPGSYHSQRRHVVGEFSGRSDSDAIVIARLVWAIPYGETSDARR